MATASGEASGTRRSVMPYVAYAVVLALLAAAGVVLWTGERGRLPILPRNDGGPAPVAGTPIAVTPVPAAPVAAAPSAPAAEPSPLTQGLKLPPRQATDAQKRAPAATPSPSPVPIPSATPPAPPSPASASTPTAPSPPSDASASAPSAVPADKPAPARSRCASDAAPWPAERTEQGKAIQGMLRDLGLYDGTVYGTVGPTTRAAIRKFQASTGQPETGEPDETLFDSLRKKCAAPAP